MRKLNDEANMGTVILAVATAITIAISILIIYSVLGGMDISGAEDNLREALGYTTSSNDSWAAWNSSTPVSNSTGSLITGLGTFFTLAPIYIIVLVAVAIIGAVMGIMVSRRR